MDPEYIRKVYSFAVQPTVSFYFRVPLKESLQRILVGRPTLKYYEAGMDLGLDPDPYKCFKIFQSRILDLYDGMVDQDGLTVIDATRPLVEQQQTVRRLVEPHLEGTLEVERVSWGKVLVEGQLHGRYLQELGCIE
jgi:dTMP kinase